MLVVLEVVALIAVIVLPMSYQGKKAKA